jgi:hypothetical protein
MAPRFPIYPITVWTMSTPALAYSIGLPQIPDEDRVVHHIALRGFATRGIALARADLVPEITITADGAYWHPVGAEDADLLVTSDIFPLADAFAAVRRAFDRESEHQRRLARIFNCA